MKVVFKLERIQNLRTYFENWTICLDHKNSLSNFFFSILVYNSCSALAALVGPVQSKQNNFMEFVCRKLSSLRTEVSGMRTTMPAAFLYAHKVKRCMQPEVHAA
jgi:hypothetical protein